jgi:hypothetical protein
MRRLSPARCRVQIGRAGSAVGGLAACCRCAHLATLGNFGCTCAPQTTNLRVGRSNRSGRAIYLIQFSPISRAAGNGPRLKSLFSLGFSLGNLFASEGRLSLDKLCRPPEPRLNLLMSGKTRKVTHRSGRILRCKDERMCTSRACRLCPCLEFMRHSFPSCIRGFDSLRPLQSTLNKALPRRFASRILAFAKILYKPRTRIVPEPSGRRAGRSGGRMIVAAMIAAGIVDAAPASASSC